MSQITINGITIDPEEQSLELASLSSSQNKDSKSKFLLVQLSGPLTADQKVELENVGLTLLEYVPDDTYITTSSKEVELVEALDFVLWASPYLNGFKLASELVSNTEETNNGLYGLTGDDYSEEHGIEEVDVVFHQGVEAENLKETVLQAAGIEKDSVEVEGNKLRITVDKSRLGRLVQIDEVRHIEKVYSASLNDDVAVSIISAVFSTFTKRWLSR